MAKIKLSGEVGRGTFAYHHSLKEYVSEDPENEWIEVDFVVRPVKGDGEDRFTVNVFTPKAFLEDPQLLRLGYKSGRHLMIIERFDYKLIRRVIKRWIMEANLFDKKNPYRYLSQFARYESDEFSYYKKKLAHHPKTDLRR